MMFLCEKVSRQGRDIIRILKCRSLDSLAVIPDMIRGLPVTDLAPYAFSSHRAFGMSENPEAFWWDSETETAEDGPPGGVRENYALRENRMTGGGPEEFPFLEGSRLEELCLPRSLQRVGAYAFYNCERLRKLEIYSVTLDWGAGVFNGCFGVRQLTFHVDEERRSCMRDILAELRQTLEVLYFRNSVTDSTANPTANPTANTAADPAAGSGPLQPDTRLIFPEYFEEAVENTPARILVTQTHGCGQRYRNAFVQTQFQFKEYDSLFAHVQVQEPEELAARLALGRLMYPYRLEENYRKMYMDYLMEHGVTAACQAVRQEDMEQLQWLFANITYDGDQMDRLLNAANRAGSGAAVSYLMEQKRRSGAVKRRRFSI